MSLVTVHREDPDITNQTFFQKDDFGPYEYSYLEYTYHEDTDSNEETNHLNGIDWVLANFMMVVVFPALLISSLVIFVVIVTSGVMRRDPSKLLIAHTAACIFFGNLFNFSKYFTAVYQLPSLVTTVLCPSVNIMMVILFQMTPISITFGLIERFVAALRGTTRESGLGKRAIIISLVLFWLFDIIIHVISFVVRGKDMPLFFHHVSYTGVKICYLVETKIAGFTRLAIGLLSIVSAIVVIIGLLIAARKKNDAKLNRYVIIPTICLSAIFLVFFFSIYVIIFIIFDLKLMWPGVRTLILLSMSGMLAQLSLPLTWLITWSLDGQLTRKMFHWRRRDDQELQLQDGMTYTPLEEVP